MTTNITKECAACIGTGTRYDQLGNPTHTCGICAGTGRLAVASVDLSTLATAEALADVLDRCNDVLDKCNDILEQVTED